MLTFNLKKEWYEKFKRGEKTVEYREIKPYWTRRIGNVLEKNAVDAEHRAQLHQFFSKHSASVCIPCIFRLGYTKQYMSAFITRIWTMDGTNSDLHIDKPVYAMHFVVVHEM